MNSTPHHPRRHWDGSRAGTPGHRRLRLTPDPGSPLLRSGQAGRCRECGNLVEWYYRPDHRPVPLHPKELPAALVPEASRWHVSSGIAYAAGDGAAWCRVPHALLCPARAPEPAVAHLIALRRRLAAHTRSLIDTGAFAPQERHSPPHRSCRPLRPVVQILGIRYLAARPVEEIACLARSSRTRARCPRRLADPACPPGIWQLLPVTLSDARQLALPGPSDMAVYDMTALPYAEQLRWRTQRCSQHTAARAQMAASDWEPFDPLAHHEHIHVGLPDQSPRSDRPRGRCRYT